MSKHFDWHSIRLRYLRGETAYGISKAMGGKPSREAIRKRAIKQGWRKVGDSDLKVAEQLPISQSDGNCVRGSRLGLRSPENIALILHCAALGLPDRTIAAAVGIDRGTLRRWQQNDPALATEMRARRSQKAAEWVQHIDNAAGKDWRAASRLLETSPETREQFGTRKTGGNAVQVIMNISRSDGKNKTIDSVVASTSATG